jgi:hypothetical protein
VGWSKRHTRKEAIARTPPARPRSPDIKFANQGSNVLLFRGTLGNRYEVRGEIILPRDRARFFTGFIFDAKNPRGGATATFVVR